MTQILREASIFALFSMLVALLPLAAGAAYLFRPSEQRLAQMRPISLAAIFAGLAGANTGFINVLSHFWRADQTEWRIVAMGSAEALVPLTLAFGSLMAAWLFVAVGMRRSSQ